MRVIRTVKSKFDESPRAAGMLIPSLQSISIKAVVLAFFSRAPFLFVIHIRGPVAGTPPLRHPHCGISAIILRHVRSQQSRMLTHVWPWLVPEVAERDVSCELGP